MKIQEIRALILKDNPTGRTADLEIYARQFATYFEASENIQQNGVICSHPRTGQPMENPYVKLRFSSETCMQKIRIKSDSLWQEAAKQLDAIEKQTQ